MSARPGLTTRYWHALVASTLLSTIVFATFWAISRYGSDLPYWDQWDSEWTRLLLPWKDGTLSWFYFYTPHNEHRIVLTKALSLAVVSLNGQWDVRLQLCVNALLHAAIALGLFLWLARHFQDRPVAVALWALALLIGFAPPHSFENTLSGFHSQQYFLLGLSLLGIERTLRARPFSAGWWIGITAMLLVLFTMASGLLAAISVIITLLLFGRFSHQPARGRWVTVGCCVLLCAAGFAMRVDVPHHKFLHAHSVREYLGAIGKYTAWPWMLTPACAAINFAPLMILFVVALKRGFAAESKEVALVAFGIWVLVQNAALAYARGMQSADPASRYLDTFVLGLLLNFAAGLVLVTGQPGARAWRVTAMVGLIVWSTVVGWGLVVKTSHLFGELLPTRIATLRQCERNVRLYLATGDAAHLKEPNIPYPGVDDLRERLSHPEIDSLLPVSVRPAVKIEAETAEGFSAGNTSGATPRFEIAQNFGSFPPGASGTWVSRPVDPMGPGYLKFEVAGNTGEPRVTLELWNKSLSAKLATVIPGKVPGDSWRAAYVPAPREPFRIVARDSSETAWIAFSAPVAMAAGSFWCWRLTEHAPLMFWISLACLGGLLGIGIIRRATPQPG